MNYRGVEFDSRLHFKRNPYFGRDFFLIIFVTQNLIMNKLLAPNGKPSNLTAKQYKLVRTPAFKKWFGDFENQYKSTLIKIVDGKLIYDGVDVGIFEITKKSDRVEIDRLYIDKEFQKKGIGKACIQYLFNNYEIELIELYPHPYTQSFWLNNGVVNVRKDGFFEIDNQKYQVSKVIDENGEPLVVYHGTKSFDINEFDLSKSKRISSGLKEFGTYFTDNKKLAEKYRDWNDLKEEEKINIDREINKLKELLYSVRNNRDYNYVEEQIKTLNDLKKGKIYSVFLNLKKMYSFDAKKEINIEAWNNLKVKASYKIAQNRDAMDFLKEGKFGVEKVDGIQAKNIVDAFVQTEELKKELLSNVYLVFDSKNIKLADGTNTTFDGGNTDIRFEDGGEIDGYAQQLIDIISINPQLENYQKYKVILKDKFGIDFDSIYKDQEYIDNANLNDIKKQDDFLDFGNWLDYAKIISNKRGFIPMDLYDTPSNKYKITDEIWNETSKKLDFVIKKVPYTERGTGSGDIARAFGDTIYYTEHADFYYFLHELGHIYDFQNNIKGIIKNPAYSPTKYGTTNSGETFAENFAIYFINPMALKKWNNDVYNAMDSEINEKYKKQINRIISNYPESYETGGEVNTGLFAQIWNWFGIKF